MATPRESITIRKYADAHPEQVASYHTEDSGHWVYLTPDHVCPDKECGTIREDRVADVMECLRTVVTLEEWNNQ